MIYVETVDFLPSTLPVYGTDVEGHPFVTRMEVDGFGHLPEPMRAALDRLVDPPHGEGTERCQWPFCGHVVGFHLAAGEDTYGRETERAGWGFVTLVWDDTEIIGQPFGEDGPRPVLVLCEDHTPDSPFVAYDAAVGQAMADDHTDALAEARAAADITEPV